MASSQAGYMTGDLYPRSRLRAVPGYMMGDLYPRSWLRAKHVIWLVIITRNHGFEPSMLCDWLIIIPGRGL
jgi:hypothetical protein